MKIGKILENLINESSRVNLNDLNDIIILSQDLNINGGLFLLYNPTIKKPLGYISFGYHIDLDVFSVGGVYSKNGFGPLLYEIAMTYVFPKGLTLSQDAGTSGDAQSVWEKFVGRGDVKKERLVRLSPSEKEGDLIDGCDNDRDCLEWANKVIELHNTKFIFSLNKQELINKIKNGSKFLANNPNFDLDELVYSLE